MLSYFVVKNEVLTMQEAVLGRKSGTSAKLVPQNGASQKCPVLHRQESVRYVPLFLTGSVLARRGNMMSEPNGTRVTVLLADDHDIMRRTVRRLLEEEPALEVLGEAATFTQAFEMGIRLKPDVILVDLHMPDDAGLDPAVIKSQLALTGSRIIAMSLSGEEDEEALSLANSYGAAKLLDKARFYHELIPTILLGKTRTIQSANA
jgi:CheY-like chemotaxis protein